MELKKKSRLPIYAGTILGVTAIAMVGTRLLVNRIADKSAPALAEAPRAVDDSLPDSTDDKVDKSKKGPAIPGQFGQPGIKPPLPGMGGDGGMQRFGPPAQGGRIPPGYSIKDPNFGQPPYGMPMRGGQPMPPPPSGGMGQMPPQGRPPAYPQQPPQLPPQQQQPPQGYPPPNMGYPPPPYYPYGMPPDGYPPPYDEEEEDYEPPDYYDYYEGRNERTNDRQEQNTAIGDTQPHHEGREADTQHTYNAEDDYLDEAFAD